MLDWTFHHQMEKGDKAEIMKCTHLSPVLCAHAVHILHSTRLTLIVDVGNSKREVFVMRQTMTSLVMRQYLTMDKNNELSDKK